MHHKAPMFAAVLLAGCAASGTSGFSKGDNWTFPLVGPLEDGLLITPVTVKGKGPYLFLIDPDANLSVIDQQVVEEAGLLTGRGPSRIDEAGSEQMRQYAELVDLQVGTLTVSRRQVMMVPSNFYNTEGRRVNGVIGHDVIAEGLVFGVDRDQGIASLTTPKTFVAPRDAIAIKVEAVAVEPQIAAAAAGTGAAMESSNVDDASRVGVKTRGNDAPLDVTPLPRRVASAQIGDAKVAMHLDLGAATSQLREAEWAKAKAAPTDVKLRLVDEVASLRQIEKAGVATGVTLGAAKSPRVTLAPYVDKRYAASKVDGSLGLDFFAPYAVYASWSTNTFYLKPRGDSAATATARLGRWGALMPACPHPGCVSVTLTPTQGGNRLDIERDAAAANRALEIRIGVKPAAGKSAPPLVAELPAKADKVSGGVPDDYAGATLIVLDASPFTRPCADEKGCVYQFDTPGQ